MQSQNEEKESLQKNTRSTSSNVNGNSKGNIIRTITDSSDSSTSNVLYYNTVNDDDDDDEESRRGIMSDNQMTQESNSHSHNHSHSHSSNNETEELKEQLKNQIDFWKKTLNFGNTFVVVMTTIIIALYFTTDLFSEPIDNNNNTNATSTNKLISMTNQCLNETIMETNDMDSFLTCAGLCSDASSCCDIDTFISRDRSDAEKQNRITTETAIAAIEAAASSSSKSTSTVSVTNAEKDATTTTITSSSCNDDKDIFPISICDNICTPILNDYLEYFITYIQTICDRDLIKNTDESSSSSSSQNQHRQLCQDKCSQLDCCFSMDDDINCLEKEELLCSSFYESCVVVHENAAMFGVGIGPQIITNKDD